MIRWRNLDVTELERLQASIRASSRLAGAGIEPPGGPGKRVPNRGTGRPRGPEVAERTILHDCLAYLNLHQGVAFAFRLNSGLVTTQDGARRFKAGFRGGSDIVGMLKGGRFLAVEVKRFGKHPTAPQQNFLNRVNHNGGLAFIATSVKDCEQALLNTRTTS